MSKMNRSLVALTLLAGCAQNTPPSVARGPVDLVKPPPVAPAATPPDATPPPVTIDPTPFAVVGMIPEGQNYGIPFAYRLGNGVAIVTTGSNGWVVHTVDGSGKHTLVSAALDELKQDVFEGVSMVQGTGPDDLWLSLEESQGRASVTAASVQISGMRHKRVKHDMSGLGTFLNGTTVGLYTNSQNPYDRLDSKSQRFEIFKGEKVAVPAIPKSIRLQDVAVFPSGKIYGIGKSAKAHSEADAWQLYTFENGKSMETHTFTKGIYSVTFVANMPESDLLLRANVQSTDDGESQTVLIRANDSTLAHIELPFAVDALEGGGEGALWMTEVGDGSNKTVHRGLLGKDNKLTTTRIALPNPSVAGAACGSEATLDVMSLVGTSDGAWISALCLGPDNKNGSPAALILHTQKQGEIAKWESADQIIEAHRESMMKKRASKN